MAKIRFDEGKLRDNDQAAKSELTVWIMPQNTPYPNPSFVSDQSGGEGPLGDVDVAGVDVYPETMDAETARMIRDF